MGYGFYPRYVTVGEKKAKAARKLGQMKKKNPDIRPILLEGRTIARTWWAKSWNYNLERYADYSNRIGRGRAYVRNGAVLDLRIHEGSVESLVQGTRSKPYSVSIGIKPLDKNIRRDIHAACEGKLDSLQALLAGDFPESLREVFMARDRGLFPAPKEIEFRCSCPDWAYMCKHVAATLYGIGARLDEDPALFFKLRQVEMKDIIARAVEDKTHKLLRKAGNKSKRVIAESDLAGVFGIEMDEHVVFSNKSKSSTSASKRKRSSAPKTEKARPKSFIEKPGKKKAVKKAPHGKKAESIHDTVLGMIRRSKKGVTVATIKKKTGLNEKQIRNVIYKAKKEGGIGNMKRGIYISSQRLKKVISFHPGVSGRL
ncbi:MAG: hypothetical protein ABII06_13580 [Pseudomonadota bacterium]